MTKIDSEENYTKGNLVLQDRRILSFDGVLDVISFDENGAILKVNGGMLVIDGTDLHVTKLDIDGGSIGIEGKISGLLFSDGVKGKKRFGR